MSTFFNEVVGAIVSVAMFQGTAHFVADLPLQPNTLFAVPILADRVAMLQRAAAKETVRTA